MQDTARKQKKTKTGMYVHAQQLNGVLQAHSIQTYKLCVSHYQVNYATVTA